MISTFMYFIMLANLSFVVGLKQEAAKEAEDMVTKAKEVRKDAKEDRGALAEESVRQLPLSHFPGLIGYQDEKDESSW